MDKTTLIIIRGPSGCGKSTVANEIRKRSSNKTAIIEQDYYREKMFLIQDKQESESARIEMMVIDTLIALRKGFDVIMDGVLDIHKHREAFDRIFAEHVDKNYIFYFDISLEETLKRHATRKKSSLFSAEQMTKWYVQPTSSNYDFEYPLSEDLSIDQIVTLIESKTKHN